MLTAIVILLAVLSLNGCLNIREFAEEAIFVSRHRVAFSWVFAGYIAVSAICGAYILIAHINK